jgi:hypothetical protein
MVGWLRNEEVQRMCKEVISLYQDIIPVLTTREWGKSQKNWKNWYPTEDSNWILSEYRDGNTAWCWECMELHVHIHIHTSSGHGAQAQEPLVQESKHKTTQIYLYLLLPYLKLLTWSYLNITLEFSLFLSNLLNCLLKHETLSTVEPQAVQPTLQCVFPHHSFLFFRQVIINTRFL